MKYFTLDFDEKQMKHSRRKYIGYDEKQFTKIKKKKKNVKRIHYLNFNEKISKHNLCHSLYE